MSFPTIENMRLTHVRVPLREPFAISSGVVSEKDAILIEVQADGLNGLGEASPMAGSIYSPQTPDSTWQVLTEHFLPTLSTAHRLDLGGSWWPESLDDPFARCGVDNALWDLAGRAAGEPLWRILGGDRDTSVESGLAVGIEPSIEQLLDRIEQHKAHGGYRRVKIKVQPGWDLEPLAAVRKRFGDVPLTVDANAAYSREHVDHLVSWDQFDLKMIEQPFGKDDLESHASLTSCSRTPVCVDESVDTLFALEKVIELQAAQILNIKLQRLGGFSPACKAHERAVEAGIDCWIGTMPELGVGAHASMNMATRAGLEYPTDVEASERWFVEEITDPPVRCTNGMLSLPDGPGLGIKLNHDAIKRYKIRECSVRLKCRLDLSQVIGARP